MLFQSGDLGEWTAEGELILRGRKDSQVKIRGYRIELAQVEAALAALTPVKAAVVLPRETSDGNTHLVAYIVVHEGRRMERPQVRAALKAVLPSHMVPSSFEFLETLPLTAHGKIDWAQLRQLPPSTPPAGWGGPPQTETEEVLAGIWAEVFHVELVGREDDFFTLGGDSLLAAVIAAKIHDSLGVSLDLAAFTTHANVGLMADRVDGDLAKISEAAGGMPSLLPASGAGPAPLSFVQERTWNICQVQPCGYTNVAADVISGPLDVEVLRACVNEIVRRHDILRTSFRKTEPGAGVVQVVRPYSHFTIPLVDLSDSQNPEEAAREFATEATKVPMDLASDDALIELWLLRLEEGKHLLLRKNHHIISDGWSWRVFFEELIEYYEAQKDRRTPRVKDLAVQYADYAAWQRACLDREGRLYQDQLEWWKQFLNGSPEPMKLPFARAEADPHADPDSGHMDWGLTPVGSTALDQLGRQMGVTYFVLRLAAFSAYLGMTTGQRDFVLGTYATNRQRVELQRLFGFFANLITLRFRFNPDVSFRAWLLEVRAMLHEAQSRSELPYESLCEELRRSGVEPPEIRAIIGISGRQPPMRFAGLELETVHRPGSTMPWGFMANFSRWRESAMNWLTFDATLYEPVGTRAFMEGFSPFVEAVAKDPDLPFSTFSSKLPSAPG
jgi:acyl carrier protein